MKKNNQDQLASSISGSTEAAFSQRKAVVSSLVKKFSYGPCLKKTIEDGQNKNWRRMKNLGSLIF